MGNAARCGCMKVRDSRLTARGVGRLLTARLTVWGSIVSARLPVTKAEETRQMFAFTVRAEVIVLAFENVQVQEGPASLLSGETIAKQLARLSGAFAGKRACEVAARHP